MESILRSRQQFESQIIKRLEEMAFKSKKQDDLNSKLLKQNKLLNHEISLYGFSLNPTDHDDLLCDNSLTLEIEKHSDYESESIEIKKLETISEE
jgi:hypothetical protein